MGSTAARRPRRPQLGEIMEAETLVGYLENRRGTLASYSDRIIVQGGAVEERFELIRMDQGVRWKRTR